MKVLVAGCSFAQAIPGIIRSKILGAETVSVAYGAAGNKFIADSVVVLTQAQNFDLIYVSWSGLSRHDVPVSDVSYFKDWPNRGKVADTDYVFTGGVGGWDHDNNWFVEELFSGYHRFVDDEQLYYNSLLEIIKTQGYLKNLGTPYYFTSMINQFDADPNHCMPHTCEFGVSKYPALGNLVSAINFEPWIWHQREGIYEFCARQNLLSNDQFHPSMQGYGLWIDLLVERLKKDKII